MRPSRSLGLLPSLLASLAFAQGKTTPPTLISACVGKFGGLTRIVASTSLCDTRLETPIQWNQQGIQGPAGTPGANGAPGPQGPAGIALPHIIPVLSTASSTQYGSALLTAVNSITDASATNPYLLLLDAGSYTLKDQNGFDADLKLPPFVSVKGAGPGVTTIVALNGSAIRFTSGPNTLSGFTISGDFTGQVHATSLVGANYISDVQAAGVFLYLGASTSNTSLNLRDSSFFYATSSSSPSVNLFITGSQFTVLQVPGDGSAICLADYAQPVGPVPTNCAPTIQASAVQGKS